MSVGGIGAELEQSARHMDGVGDAAGSDALIGLAQIDDDRSPVVGSGGELVGSEKDD